MSTATVPVAERAAELRRDRVPFVHARVVLAERPTSAHPGDEALVLADGSMEGFVGGTCAETTVRAQALALLDSGDTLLLRIAPDGPEEGEPSPAPAVGEGRLVVHNPCLSGGTIEVFLEPVIPRPLLAVAGDGPIARALATVGASLGYDVAPSVLPLPDEVGAVVVASHGRDETSVLEAALRAGVPYVGLVASRRRAAGVLGELDVPDELREKVRSPAGIDLGATTAEESALEILAEIVRTRPRSVARGPRACAEPAPESAGVAIDPICGMEVATVESSLHLDRDGERHWFCGSGCLRAFAAADS
ncbi:MAG: XdhC family protein [Actinomycetota bacterium]|nr:XdhC family protein [Actinomycetota bacterium]